MTSLVDTRYVNGRPFTASYSSTSAGRTLTLQSPAGRRSVALLDAFGRTTQLQLPGLAPIDYTYDAHGRLVSTKQGTRSVSIGYDPRGYVASVTDPLSRQVTFSRDAAGRPLALTTPDGQTVRMTYDANGNVSSIAPPGRPAHAFTYTPLDLEQSYTPPSVGSTRTTTTSSYQLDEQLSSISRPDGDVVSTSYDSAGRLASVSSAARTVTTSYDPLTGNLASLAAPDFGSLRYAYDGALPTDTTWSGVINGTLHRTFDNDFRLASESVNGGPPVTYQYDADGLLIAAGALQIQRDPATGFQTGATLGGITESRTYSAYGEEASYTSSFAGSNLYSVTYARPGPHLEQPGTAPWNP